MTVIGLCVTSAIAGFAYEAMRTEMVINQRGFKYAFGSGSAHMSWEEVRVMILHWNKRSQVMELRGDTGDVHIDLTEFAAPDRVLVVKIIERFARLLPTPQRGPVEWVWRKRRDSIEIRDQ